MGGCRRGERLRGRGVLEGRVKREEVGGEREGAAAGLCVLGKKPGQWVFWERGCDPECVNSYSYD